MHANSQSAPRDIVVLGAGIVGACSALELLARGFAVTLIDKGDKTLGASYGNAGTISPFSCVPFSMPGAWRNVPKWLLVPDGPLSVRPGHFLRFMPWGLSFLLNGESREKILKISNAMAALSRDNTCMYAQHLKGTGSEELLRPSCYILAYRDPNGIDTGKLDYRLRLKAGARMEIANMERLQELEPALSRDFKAAIVMHGQGRATSPGNLRDTLIKKALSQGASFHRKTARSLRRDANGGWAVETDTETIRATNALVTAGAWSADLLEPIGIKVPLEPEYGYHIEVPDAAVTINNTIMDTDTKTVASSMLDGVRVSGFADFRGKLSTPTNRRSHVLVRHATAMFPGLNAKSYSAWAGPRPSFPDSLPVIGGVPNQRNLFVAFGHSHFGFGMAPRTGELIAQIIAGENPDVDMAPYSISRF